MALKPQPLEALKNFIPPNCFEEVLDYLHRYGIHLSLKKPRRSVYGDYQAAFGNQPHKISVNANLNSYHFLITLLHEIAHLLVFVEYRDRVKPHGAEWKSCFADLLKNFLEKDVFPEDIVHALERYIQNPGASTCSSPLLLESLKKYDKPNGLVFVKNIGVGNLFYNDKGESCRVLRKRRTRWECENLVTKTIYLFPDLYEVEKA